MNGKHLEKELKKEFQLERMILFSDAVFAIAITLLVIEIKVPEIPKLEVTESKLLESLEHMIPKFVGFIISFFIIGLYWTIHHRMFANVVNYTKKTLWLNLWFLFAVILMPFSTAFYSEYILRLLKTPVIIYVGNIFLLGIMNYMLFRHINNPALHLTEGADKQEVKYFAFRAIVVPSSFVLIAIAYLINPKYALFLPLVVAISVRLAIKYFLPKPVAVPTREEPLADEQHP